MNSRRLSLGFLLFAFAAALAADAADPASRRFDVPAGDALGSLKLFAEQSGQEIVYPPDTVRGTRTNAIKGDFPPKEAIDRMLGGTTLIASQTKAGILAVTRLRDANDFKPAPAPAKATPPGTV